MNALSRYFVVAGLPALLLAGLYYQGAIAAQSDPVLKKKSAKRSTGQLPGLMLEDGTNLAALRVRGKSLSLVRGQNGFFTKADESRYKQLYRQARQDPAFPVQWQLRNLDTGKVVSRSAGSERNFYGASVTKVFTAGAWLARHKGQHTPAGLQLLADMITVSSNRAWQILQNQSAEGSLSGQQAVAGFSKGLGIKKTKPWRGWLGSNHGNETNAADLNEFMLKTYRKAYPGAGTLWSLLHTCRTGSRKALKWLPASMLVGGKTGTYHGPTVHAVTGKPYRARVHHHTLTFRSGGQQYALSILSDRGRNDDVALVAGGLYRQFLKTKDRSLQAANDQTESATARKL